MIKQQSETISLVSNGHEKTSRRNRVWLKTGLVALVIVGVVAVLHGRMASDSTVDTSNAMAQDVPALKSVLADFSEEISRGKDETNMGGRPEQDAACTGDNIALRKNTWQSSTYRSSTAGRAVSSRAVDGNTDGNYRSRSCSHTLRERDPFWFVDLGDEYRICGVKITNRACTTGCRNRLSRFVIFTTNERPEPGFQVTAREQCAFRKNSFRGTLEIKCGKKGRYIGVQIKGRRKILSLCEFEVFVQEGNPTTEPVPTPRPTCGPRIRKDWHDLTKKERDLYISGYKRLRKNKKLNTFTAEHVEASESGSDGFKAHGVVQFLPWHRYFLYELEEQIRNLGKIGSDDYRCFTLPYWDWTRMSGKLVAENNMFRKHGLGGDGDRTGCVTSGEFAEGKYQTSNKGCLERAFEKRYRPYPTIIATLNYIEKAKDYSAFLSLIKRHHDTAHSTIGGNMLDTFSSPDDPMFYLLHCFVDFQWAFWSDCHDYEKAQRVTNNIYPTRVVEDPMGYPVLLGQSISWAKGAERILNRKMVLPRDMLKTSVWKYTYDASDMRSRSGQRMGSCNFDRIDDRQMSLKELVRSDNEDVPTMVNRQMRAFLQSQPVAQDGEQCRRAAEKACLLTREEIHRRGYSKQKCRYNVDYEKCPGYGVLEISLKDLLDKRGVAGNECLMKIRTVNYDFAMQMDGLRALCNGVYDPKCTGRFPF